MQRSAFLLLAGFLAAPLGCNALQFDHTRTENQTLEIRNLHAIDLSTYNGSIEVSSHDASTVAMHISYKSQAYSEDAAQANCESLDCAVSDVDGLVRITAENPNKRWFSSVSFVLQAPADCDLILKTSNGSVSVKEMFADVKITTSNGAIACNQLTGALDAETSNGKIVVEGGQNSATLSTSNGTVIYAGRLVGDQNVIRTSNGRVSISVPSNGLTEVVAKTSNGSIECELPETQTLQADKHAYHAIVGEASDDNATPKVSVRTSNGSIQIKPLTGSDSEQPASEWSERGIEL